MNKFIKSITVLIACGLVSVAWADATETQTEDSVASIGTKSGVTAYYADLQEALTVLQSATKEAGYILTLLKDVDLSEGLTFTDNMVIDGFPPVPYNNSHARYEWHQIDLDGHTITVTDGTIPAMTITGSNAYASIGIRNGNIIAKGTTPGAMKVDIDAWVHIIDVNMSSACEGETLATCEFACTFNGLLKGCEITNSKDGVAVRMNAYSGLIHSSTITCENGIGVAIKQLSEGGGGAAIATSTVTGATSVFVDPETAQDVYITGGSFDGELIDDSAHLWICGGTYRNTSSTPDLFTDAGYTMVENGDKSYIVSDESAVLVDGVPSNITDAFNLSGVKERTIKLNGSIFLIGLEKEKDLISVGNGQNITLDLNGHNLNVFDVSASFSNVNCGKVSGTGTLNVIDSSGKDSGKIAFAAWVMDFRSTPGYANNMFSVRDASTMNVDSGIIENISKYKTGWSMASYCVDMYEASKLNVTGGRLVHSNTCVRMFFSNSTGQHLSMTGGVLDGGLTAIWVQGGSKVDVDITGGELFGLGNYGVIYNTSTPSGNVTIDGTAQLTGNIFAFATGNEKFYEIKGGCFFDDGAQSPFYKEGNERFKGRFINGETTHNSVYITGGYFDPSFIFFYNYTKFCEEEANQTSYYTVAGTLRMEELEVNEETRVMYGFGEPVAQLVQTKLDYVYPTGWVNKDTTIENFASLPLAVFYSGMSVAYYDELLDDRYEYIGNNVDLVADDLDAKPHVFNTDGFVFGYDDYFGDMSYIVPKVSECQIRLNGHKVVSSSTEPLITVADCDNMTYAEQKMTLKIMGEGEIKCAGSIFAVAPGTRFNDIAIYGGAFKSDNTEGGFNLFASQTPDQIKVYSDVDGIYGTAFSVFIVNEASFSHDVSANIYNANKANIKFTTIQQPDGLWYLGRDVAITDKPAK